MSNLKIKFESRDFRGMEEEFQGWRIWEKPKELHTYAIGADVAEGKGKDASCAQIVDCGTGMVVANFWSNIIDEDNYAAELYKAGYYYNRAKLIVEANNSGSAVITNLTGVYTTSLRYPYMYKRLEYDQFTRKKTKIVGYRTTGGNKAQLISNVKAALRDGDLKLYDKHTINELSTFVRDEKTGKIGAKGVANDDRVMSLALAWEQVMVLRNNMRKDTLSNNIERKYDPETGFPI
jgi:hypothetical protein